MTQILGRHCPACKEFGEVEARVGNFSCPNCGKHWGKFADLDNVFDRCPVCECRQFYLMKSFNQFLGLVIMVIGIVLVPVTYGLSLPVFCLIDWLLYKKIQTIVCCYKCGTEFRNFNYPKRLKPFMHHIGLKYDKFRK